MQTIFSLMLFVGLSVVSVGQDKKPIKLPAWLKSSKQKNSSKNNTQKEYHLYFYYRCPKCGYKCIDKGKTGLCPGDKNKLYYTSFGHDGPYNSFWYQVNGVDCLMHD